MPQVMALQESVAASGAIKVPAAADVRRPVSTGRTRAGAGAEPAFSNAAGAAEQIARELPLMRKVARRANIQAD